MQPPQIGRELRGEDCVVQAPKCNRPHLQAEPFDVAPCRVFPRPGSYSSPRGDVFFHELLQLGGLLVGILAVATLVDVFEKLSALWLIA